MELWYRFWVLSCLLFRSQQFCWMSGQSKLYSHEKQLQLLLCDFLSGPVCDCSKKSEWCILSLPTQWLEIFINGDSLARYTRTDWLHCAQTYWYKYSKTGHIRYHQTMLIILPHTQETLEVIKQNCEGNVSLPSTSSFYTFW